MVILLCINPFEQFTLITELLNNVVQALDHILRGDLNTGYLHRLSNLFSQLPYFFFYFLLKFFELFACCWFIYTTPALTGFGISKAVFSLKS